MARILNEEDISKHYKNKSAFSSEEVLSRLSLDEQSLQIAKKARYSVVPIGEIEFLTKSTSSSERFLQDLQLKDTCVKKAHIGKEICKTTYIELTQKDKSQKQLAPKTLNLNNYSESRVTPRVINSIVDMLCEQFSFLYIEGMALYVYTEDYYHLFTYTYAGQFLQKVFRESKIDYAFRICDYKEIVNQLKAQECITKCPEDCSTATDIVLFSDGAFKVRVGTMQSPSKKDFQFSKIDFPLHWSTKARPTPDAECFIQRFCSYDDKKEAYLWELIGYLLSGYQEKIMVVFYGPSNSGKSTLANFIQRIVGTKNCVSMGIRDLSGTFNLAELQGKRLCVDSEMDATSLREKDISILKKVVGNDYIQGNRKHEQQFYFQCQAKLLICTNNRIAIRSDEDSIPLLNRIRGFQLQDSIPPQDQCHNMNQILDENRTYFLQRAMEGLQDLVHNNFEFCYTEPAENFVKNTSPFVNTASVQEFVSTCCISGDGLYEPVGKLYEAYVEYAVTNSWQYLSKNHFSTTLCEKCGFTRHKVQGTRCILNLQLKTEF